MAAWYCTLAVRAANDRAHVSAVEHAPHGRFGIFVYPPPGQCFHDEATVYVATALSDGLFADARIRQEGIHLRLRIHDGNAWHDMSTVAWDSDSSEEADEGLAHHFSIPGLPDGEYDAELSILLGSIDGPTVGTPAETSFFVDHHGKCSMVSLDNGGSVHSGAGAGGVEAEHGAQEAVLLNVAEGKRAWMSSVAAGSAAAYAVDGITMVSSLVERNAVSAAGEGGAGGEWWEVDLGEVHEVEAVDVWAGKRAAAAGSYPPILSWAANESSPKWVLTLLGPDWSPLARWPGMHGEGVDGDGIFSWRVGGGHLVRYVRVSLPPPDSVEEVAAREREIALLEVQVFAYETWNCTRHCQDRGRGFCARTEPLRTAGPCTCKPDRVGFDCAAHLLTDFAFLPPLLSPTAPLEHSRWRRETMQQAEEQVAHVQYSGTCEAPDAIVLGYHPGGLAASLSLISSMLSMTQSWNRALLLWRKADWFYADPDECPDRQMDCFFQAWHACDTDKVDNFAEGAMHIKVEESWTTRGVQPFAWVPPAHADKGLFWWRAVLNRFLFRLHPKFAGELGVDSVMARLGLLGERFIGVHVRLGDSCVKWRELFGGECLSITAHLAHTRLLAWKYGIRRVFVASDDPSVPSQFVHALSGLTVVSAETVQLFRGVLADMEQSKGEWTENRLRKGEIARGQLLRSTLLDLEILSRAAAMVGHFASNLSRMAYSLAVAYSQVMCRIVRACLPCMANMGLLPMLCAVGAVLSGCVPNACPAHLTPGERTSAADWNRALCLGGRCLVLSLADVLRYRPGGPLPHVFMIGLLGGLRLAMCTSCKSHSRVTVDDPNHQEVKLLYPEIAFELETIPSSYPHRAISRMHS